MSSLKHKLSDLKKSTAQLLYNSLLELNETTVNEEFEKENQNDPAPEDIKLVLDTLLSLLGSELKGPESPIFSSMAMEDSTQPKITALIGLKPNLEERITATTFLGQNELWSSANFHRQLDFLENLIPRMIARIEQSSASKPPFLTPGPLTPEALRAWEMACAQFFLHKEVKDDEQVKRVAYGMQEPVIQDWYLNDWANFNKLSFKDYLAEVCTYWLPTDWADTIRRTLLGCVQGQRPFSKWAVDIKTQNTLLHGTASHLTDLNILYHLESHMNTDLAAAYHAEGVKEKDLCKWINIVHLLDKKRLHYNNRLDSAFHAERIHNSTYKKPEGRMVFRPNNASANKTTRNFICLPMLMDAERQFLRENDGCYKCREPFAGHTSATCPRDFPDGATYKTLTAAAIAAKKGKKRTGGVIVAVEVDSSDEGKENNTIAVVMLSAVLGNGTDSGEECMAPL
ncbi:hypothetical protein BDR07DRAFT_1498820 [Suillus spraguei]|nr:hypothetical protein BDR07DRAFT_1498820 [Suillus spraguei]